MFIKLLFIRLESGRAFQGVTQWHSERQQGGELQQIKAASKATWHIFQLLV